MDKRTNTSIRRLLGDLRSSLSRVFSESSDVNRALHRIRDQGWSLYLVIDKSEGGAAPNAFEISAQPRCSDSDPTFRIDGHDLSFLRSVGIDPTRTLRRRRRNG